MFPFQIQYIQDKLFFKEMVNGGTRRTAAASFMEILQLKTWDLLELSQGSAFGDIAVMPTVS
jgi:chromatin segregation and condensation protein Rec8/ScpA/Scc1 (kleisin family)